MNNIVGIDWDYITKKEAKKRQQRIEKNEPVSTMLFRTTNGFHIKLIYPYDLTVDQNFMIREKYKDCNQRLKYSHMRYKTTGQGHDILFNMKKGRWRKLIG